MMKVISDELKEIKDKYTDIRRTRIIKGGVKAINEEDLIPEKESVLVFTKGGYVKRTDPSEYHTQKRGGVGVIDIETKEEELSLCDRLFFFLIKGFGLIFRQRL